MPTFAQARILNNAHSLTGKTALIIGGTSGLGEAIATRLASLNAKVVISGRNVVAAEKIISTLQTNSTPHSFLPIDLSSLSDITRFTTELKDSGIVIDILAITAGFMATDGRNETVDKIDKKLCVHYYGRFKLINELMPLMHAWNTRVLSVLAAGKGGSIDVNDLDLKKNYSVRAASLHAPAYNDLMILVTLKCSNLIKRSLEDCILA